MAVTRRIRDYDTGEISWTESTTLRSANRAKKILGNKDAKAVEKEAKQGRLRKMKKREKKLSNF